MKSAKKTFITEVLFADWLSMQLIPRNDQLRHKTHCDEPIILLVDGYANSIVPPGVTCRVFGNKLAWVR
jgi:hypothetical protein